MSIALYDDDFRRYVHVPFNLELMKIASYYKKNNEIVVLTPSLIKDRHSTTFVRKDYDDGFYISNPLAYDNLNMGGLAYTKGIYVPMDEEIEKCCADTSIYNRVAPLFCTSPFYERAFSVMQNAAHLRLSLDGETIWKSYSKQLPSLAKVQCLFFHDLNLNGINGSKDMVKGLARSLTRNPSGRRIGSKFPIQVFNGQDLVDWADFRNTAAFYSIQYNGVIDDEPFHDFGLMVKGTTISEQLIYDISAGAPYATNEFLMKDLPRIFKQIIFLRRCKLKMRLTYRKDFFLDSRWEDLIDLWNQYAAQIKWNYSERSSTITLLDFVTYIDKRHYAGQRHFTLPEARNLFNFVKEQNYELFKLFYECNAVSLKGGVFENDSIRN